MRRSWAHKEARTSWLLQTACAPLPVYFGAETLTANEVPPQRAKGEAESGVPRPPDFHLLLGAGKIQRDRCQLGLGFPATLQHLVGCLTLLSACKRTSATQMTEPTTTALPLPSSGGPQAERHPRHIKYRLLGIKPSRQTSQNTPAAKPSERSEDWLPSPTAELNLPNILKSSLSAEQLYISSAFQVFINSPLRLDGQPSWKAQPESETVALLAKDFSARPTHPP